ncbi:MAG: hypothetical protein ACW96X_06280 [Promethearchaeota archaeon]
MDIYQYKTNYAIISEKTSETKTKVTELSITKHEFFLKIGLLNCWER